MHAGLVERSRREPATDDGGRRADDGRSTGHLQFGNGPRRRVEPELHPAAVFGPHGHRGDVLETLVLGRIWLQFFEKIYRQRSGDDAGDVAYGPRFRRGEPEGSQELQLPQGGLGEPEEADLELTALDPFVGEAQRNRRYL